MVESLISVCSVVTPPASERAEDAAALRVKGSQMMFRTELHEAVESLCKGNPTKHHFGQRNILDVEHLTNPR